MSADHALQSELQTSQFRSDQPQQRVWVAYASPTQHYYLQLPFQQGMSVADAIAQSAITQQVNLPEPLIVGIFGVRVEDMDQVLKAGDRVEIYRALTINPKEIRRKRAAANPVSRYCRGNRFKQASKQK